MFRFTSCVAVLAVLAGMGQVSAPRAAVAAGVPSMYTLIDLGTLGGGHSYATDVNNLGEVVGWSDLSGSSSKHAFVYRNGQMIDLGAFRGDSYASAINDHGEIVGKADSPHSAYHAFLFRDGTMIDIHPAGNEYDSQAMDINNLGQVTGFSYLTGAQRAFLWDETNGMVELGTLGGATNGQGINDSGAVVGGSMTPARDNHAFILYPPGEPIDLGTLGGRDGNARDVNDLGLIAGAAQTANGWYHAFSHDGGYMLDLGTLGGATSHAYGVNESGLIVGKAAPAVGSDRAFVYAEGVMYDLNDLIPPGSTWFLTRANAINDTGYIAARGRSTVTDAKHALLLIPEPSTVSVDIKPGSDPNSVNLKSKGVLPVSILTTDEVDALTVNVETLLFGDPLLIDGGNTPVGPIRSNEDDVNHDGLLDLVLFFSLPEMVDNGVLGPLSEEAILTGMLLDGTQISGSDLLRIIPKSKGKMSGVFD